VKHAQELLHVLAGLLGFCILSEAVAELPRIIVKRGAMPGELSDVAIPQDNEVVLSLHGPPEAAVPSERKIL